MVAGGADEGGVIPSEATNLPLAAWREALVRLASRAQQEKPRNVGTPNIAGLYSLAGFDRSIRRHGVRGLIDFPYPCRTVTTQVLLYGERISCVQRPHNYLGQCRITAELPSSGVPPKTVTSGY